MGVRGRRFRRSATLLLAAGALLVAACGPAPDEKTAAVTNGPVLPFLADDYASALAQARTQDLPLFVENWAPW